MSTGHVPPAVLAQGNGALEIFLTLAPNRHEDAAT